MAVGFNIILPGCILTLTHKRIFGITKLTIMNPLFVIHTAVILPAFFCIFLLFYVSPSDAQMQGKQGKPDGYYISQRYNLWMAQVKEYTQLLLDGYGLWDRDNNYVPLVYKEIAHTPEALKIFEGYYQDTRGQFLYIREKDNQLLLIKLWDGSGISFVPDSSMHFFCKGNTTFTLGFTRKPEGALSLNYDNEWWENLKEPLISDAAWKAFEGTFRSKDDPDNLIRVSAKGSSLLVKQLWNGLETKAKPLSDLFFCNSDQSFTILNSSGIKRPA